MCREPGGWVSEARAWCCQVLYIAHAGDSGAIMACSSYDLHFPLRLTTDHKPNRPDEHARIKCAAAFLRCLCSLP